MDFTRGRLAGSAARCLYVAALLGCCGCSIFQDDRVEESLVTEAEPAADGDTSAEAEPVAIAALSDDGWIRRAGDAEDGAWRWRHPGLEELLEAADSDPHARAKLLVSLAAGEGRSALRGGDSVVAVNAAIGLARMHNPQGAKRLIACARDATAKLPLRLAAVEALASLSDPLAVPELRALLDEFGRHSGPARSRYVPELHAELVRGLVRQATAADAARLGDALASPAPLVRRETLLALADLTSIELPAAAVALRLDDDPQVRMAAIRFLAARQHPDAQHLLGESLADGELDVRLATITALGTLPGEDARSLLRPLLAGQPELVREAAVRALAQAGDVTAVLDASQDESSRVRLAVAAALAGLQDQRATSVAADLAQDRSPLVQQRLVESLAGWPLDSAGPLLLSVMERGGYLARQAAAEQLAERWPAAEGLSVATPADRREKVIELRRQWTEEFGGMVQVSTAEVIAEQTAALAADSATEAAEMERLLDQLASAPADSPERQRLLGELVAFGPPLLRALERRVLAEDRPLDNDLWTKVLPRLEENAGMAESLATGDLRERRQVAEKLESLKSDLSPLLKARLAILVIAEPDGQVWRSVFSILEDDGNEPALRLACAGASHPLGEVRRRACEHLGRHGRAEHADALLPALQDEDPSVVLAAAAALGAIGGSEAAPALESLLDAPDHGLRVVAAAALARIGSPAGAAALDRLAWDADPKVRRQSAVAMGELAEPTYTAALIRMLDDQPMVQRAALESLPLVAGRDVIETAAEPPPTLAEHTQRWKDWWAESDSH